MFAKKDISLYSDIINVDSIVRNTKNLTQNQAQAQEVKTSFWLINNHNISTCFTPGDNIYINIVSNSSYKTYDTFIRESDLDISLELFYVLMTKTFDLCTKYKLSWQFDTNSLGLTFSTVLDDFIPLGQSICLNEKILSGDKHLTLKLTEMESKHQTEVSILKRKIYELENKEIIFGHGTDFGQFLTYSPSTKLLDLTQTTQFSWLGNYMDFNKLTSVEIIIMNNNRFTYQKRTSDIFNGSDYRNYFHSNNGYFFLNSLRNLFNSLMIYMPSVKELEITYADETAIPTMLRSLPNLSTLRIRDYSNALLNSFNLIKNIPELKHLEYVNCLNIENLDQIKNWCSSKNIQLDIK